MAKTKATQIAVKDLKLDLQNFRTVPQTDEASAIHAMVSVNPTWFWALTESLLDGGYHPTENILVIKGGKAGTDSIVKEGNRRIAALKLILGHVHRNGLTVPPEIETRMGSVGTEWKATNQRVPCVVYRANDAAIVDKIVTLTHGKGEKAGRDSWNTVARARHNRDKNNGNEPALDLLESYLKAGKNLTALQRERWAGDYPLTILEDAMKRYAPRLGFASPTDLAAGYAKMIGHKAGLEDILRDIGDGDLGFAEIRDNTADIAANKYGLPSLTAAAIGNGGAGTGNGAAGTGGAGGSATGIAGGGGGTTGTAQGKSQQSSKSKSVATNDPRSVVQVLRKFWPAGYGREKVAALVKEARQLRIEKTPLAFCFVLRSMFEISAKAYCADHKKTGGPCATKPDGTDRTLVDVLRDVTGHLTKNITDKAMVRHLHGAMAEIAKKDGLLSITSMNQLVHHKSFSVGPTDISILFHNIFPLLDEMNK